MRKLREFLQSAKGLCMIALVALALVLLFGIQYGADTLAAIGLPTPVPAPLPQPPPSPELLPVKPLATPDPDAPRKVPDRAPTPEPYVRPSYPIHGPEDVITAVLNDRNFQVNLDDPVVGPHAKGATPGEPIFIKSISAREIDWDYYVVPFYKDGRVSGVATVGVKDGMGVMGAWYNWDADRYPLINAAEAKEIVAQTGHQVVGEPRLVHRQLRESGPRGLPFWEVRTADGETLYVIFDKVRIIGVYKATEVHIVD
jgi:hypothetical protein